MTLTRAVLAFVIFVLVADYKFGNGQLVQAVLAQTAQLGYKLSDQFSGIVHHISP
jgi:hypothetical protein